VNGKRTPSEAQPILIGYDGSEFAKRAVRDAGRLFPGRRTLVVSAYPSDAATAAAASIGIPPAVLGEAAHRLDEEARKAAQERAEEGAQLGQAAGLAAEGRAEIAAGSIWSTLIRLAESENALAIVVGSRGLTGLEKVLLGSTASGLVHHSSRPVVVIRDSNDD
jgi:nucleotide-binding universal stress UspA family protein